METIQNDSPLQHLYFIYNTLNDDPTNKAANRFFHLLKNFICGTIIHLFWNDCMVQECMEQNWLCPPKCLFFSVGVIDVGADGPIFCSGGNFNPAFHMC